MNGVYVRGAQVLSSGKSHHRDIFIHEHRFVAKLPKKIGISIDAEGLFVTPGLIDLQINGFCGKEFIEGDEPVVHAQSQLPSYGVTAFLPTMGSMPLERYNPLALQGINDRAKKRPGAEVIGWHLEGPFLNPHQCGIHRPSHMLDHLDEPLWSELFRTHAIALMTLAPEVPCAERLLDLLLEFKIPSAIGHSEAKEPDLLLAQQKGVCFVSHLFNAMVPFHHRSPGIIGSVLGEKRFGYTLISDLHHLFSSALKIAFRAHPEGLALVTDGAPLMGSQEKTGTFLGNPIEVFGDKVVTKPKGELAGSIVPFDEQVRRFMKATECSFSFAVRAASEIPASFASLGHRKGKIAQGFDADCVLWEMLPDGPCVVATFCRGEVAFSRADFWARVTHYG